MRKLRFCAGFSHPSELEMDSEKGREEINGDCGRRRSTVLHKGKSDSFIFRSNSLEGQLDNSQIKRKNTAAVLRPNYDYFEEETRKSSPHTPIHHHEDAFISRTSSTTSHQILSLGIAGPVFFPNDHSFTLSDVQARRQAEDLMEMESYCKDNDQKHISIDFPMGARNLSAPPLPISLKFVDVTYKVAIERSSIMYGCFKTRGANSCEGKGKEKQILHGITGYVLCGEVLALMGPSGSGKTTLINLLSGRLSPMSQQGTITYNNMPYSKALKRRMGFVMQDDVLYPHLTVKETLMYAALLRLPKKLSKKAKMERAMEVIYELGLERCQDTMIGGPFLRGVSGGERKRVCMGQEILVDPSLLFLDEPTSGLDSTTALRLVQMLRQISQVGRTVVTTIHQPSSRLFHMFDKLILLSEGHLIYSGKAAAAMDYFSYIGFSPQIAMNPADFLLDLASGNVIDMSVPGELTEQQTSAAPGACLLQDGINIASMTARPLVNPKKIRQYLLKSYEVTLEPLEKGKLLQELGISPELQEAGTFRGREWSSTWRSQFSVLYLRGLRERRHEYLSWLRVTQVMATAVIIGCLWWQSNLQTEQEVADQVGLLFFIATYWGFFPLFTALFTFPQDRAILAKERASDMYRLSAYFMARTLGDVPLDLCLPMVFHVIVYFMVHLKQTALAFFLTLLTILLSTVTSQGMGIAIGAAMMDLKKATTLASVVLLTFMLSGGFFVQKLPPFISWLKYASYNYYTFKLLVKVQYDDGQRYDCNTPVGCRRIADSPALRNISLNGGTMEALVLLSMVVGYRLLAYLALRRMKLAV